MKLRSLIFADGQAFYDAMAKKYRQHDKGLFVLAPSGAGKTRYCNNQQEPHWIDGDDLWMGAGAHPDGAWWEESLDVVYRIVQRCDLITEEAKSHGFWIMGASNYLLKPDAVVIPDWKTHQRYIAHREKLGYDGGARSDTLDRVRRHIEAIEKWHHDHGVPLFNSIDHAVAVLTEGQVG
jgi:hypothetical protein